MYYGDCNVSFANGNDNGKKIIVGSPTVCPECGEYHEEEDYLFCRDCGIDFKEFEEVLCEEDAEEFIEFLDDFYEIECTKRREGKLIHVTYKVNTRKDYIIEMVEEFLSWQKSDERYYEISGDPMDV